MAMRCNSYSSAVDLWPLQYHVLSQQPQFKKWIAIKKMMIWSAVHKHGQPIVVDLSYCVPCFVSYRGEASPTGVALNYSCSRRWLCSSRGVVRRSVGVSWFCSNGSVFRRRARVVSLNCPAIPWTTTKLSVAVEAFSRAIGEMCVRPRLLPPLLLFLLLPYYRLDPVDGVPIKVGIVQASSSSLLERL